MHHRVVDRWSRGASPLHTLHAQAKIVVLLGFLVSLSTTPSSAQSTYGAYALLALLAAASSRLPVGGLLLRAALVLPFSVTFAFITWWSGDGPRALTMLERSYLSGMGVVLFIATTPLVAGLSALEAWHFPRVLLLVMQFLYRYLFVIAEQAQRIRQAAACRGRKFGFRAAAGALGVLFAKSWQRAEGVPQAMLARGFSGRFAAAVPAPFSSTDGFFLVAGLAVCVGVRIIL